MDEAKLTLLFAVSVGKDGLDVDVETRGHEWE